MIHLFSWKMLQILLRRTNIGFGNKLLKIKWYIMLFFSWVQTLLKTWLLRIKQTIDFNKINCLKSNHHQSSSSMEWNCAIAGAEGLIAGVKLWEEEDVVTGVILLFATQHHHQHQHYHHQHQHYHHHYAMSLSSSSLPKSFTLSFPKLLYFILPGFPKYKYFKEYF